jgi:N-acetylglucosaminyldiphosphoundecaprenol N-acetyl-beta-D-mannosaminyltransferase
MLGQVVPPRVTGISLFLRLVRVAANNGWPVFLLGDREPVVAAVAGKLRHAYPTLELVGHHHGFFEDEQAMVGRIRAAKPALLFVAMGTPRQEVFLHAHREALHVPFCMGVGGSFSVVANVARRTPPALGDRGLEWLHRLAQDPSRLMRRNVVEHGGFIDKVVRARLGLHTSMHD